MPPTVVVISALAEAPAICAGSARIETGQDQVSLFLSPSPCTIRLIEADLGERQSTRWNQPSTAHATGRQRPMPTPRAVIVCT